MPIASPHVRHNYLAIAVAAVAGFLFETGWYSIFLDAWLKGIGHDRAWLDTTRVNLLTQCVTALFAAALLALAISAFTQATGPLTTVRGIRIAAGLWLGCVLPTIAVGEVFAVRSYASFAVNAGFWLLEMTLMGAIVGAWKKPVPRN
jgi:hypothetical protein